jgi:hypothetical protein
MRRSWGKGTVNNNNLPYVIEGKGTVNNNNLPTQIQIKTDTETDMFTKKPASLMHFTTLAPGKAALNLSQCNIEDKPPAEHPPSRACKQNVQT